MIIKETTKKLFVLFSVLTLSLAVSADCRQTCQEEYDECMEVSSSSAKEKICGSILRECEMECATGGY